MVTCSVNENEEIEEEFDEDEENAQNNYENVKMEQEDCIKPSSSYSLNETYEYSSETMLYNNNERIIEPFYEQQTRSNWQIEDFHTIPSREYPYAFKFKKNLPQNFLKTLRIEKNFN